MNDAAASTAAHIRQSVERAIQFYTDHPEKAESADKAAHVRWQDGLRFTAEGANGTVFQSDMPEGVGGGASAPTPGWFMRAALASCDASMIALRAAQLGVTLSTLEVSVDSRSDNRGFFGIGDAFPAGPLAMRVQVRIAAADGTPPQRLREIVQWAEAHSPVGDALRRAVPCSVEVVDAA